MLPLPTLEPYMHPDRIPTLSPIGIEPTPAPCLPPLTKGELVDRLQRASVLLRGDGPLDGLADMLAAPPTTFPDEVS